MLYVLCGVAPRRFAISGAQVIEVVPLVPLRPLPETPAEVAGSFEYRGRPLPAIDLARVLEGRASVDHLSTRILVVRYHRPDAGGDAVPLGVIAERATDMLRVPDAELAARGLGDAGGPYRGQIATRSGELVPVIDVQALLPPALRGALFSAAAGDRAGTSEP